jgi:hypothetical protein
MFRLKYKKPSSGEIGVPNESYNKIYKKRTFFVGTRAVWKVSSHFEYLENRLRGLDVTWQPVRGDLSVHP